MINLLYKLLGTGFAKNLIIQVKRLRTWGNIPLFFLLEGVPTNKDYGKNTIVNVHVKKTQRTKKVFQVIFVIWKSAPLLPKTQLQWHSRIQWSLWMCKKLKKKKDFNKGRWRFIPIFIIELLFVLHFIKRWLNTYIISLIKQNILPCFLHRAVKFLILFLDVDPLPFFLKIKQITWRKNQYG